MSEIINTNLPNRSIVVASAIIYAAYGCGAVTFAVPLISFGFPQFVLSLLCPPPFNSAVCINPPSATALPEITAEACIVLGFISRLDTGFSEENEPVVSEGAIRDS